MSERVASVEYFEEAWDEGAGVSCDASCPCGNDISFGSGFYFAHRDGFAHSFVDPPEGWGAHQTMGCPDCGRFFRQIDHDERGYPVAGYQVVDRRIDMAYASAESVRKEFPGQWGQGVGNANVSL